MTTTTLPTNASDRPVAPPTLPTREMIALRDAIYLELAATASLERDWTREIDLSLQNSDESEEEIGSEGDNQSVVLMFIAVDHAKPARFEPAVVKAEPGFDYTYAPGRSAVVRSDYDGFSCTFYIDDPCEHVTGPFVHGEPRFGILERAGHLFLGVGLGDLQAFTAMTFNAAGNPKAPLSMETSAAGNGFMLELVNSMTGEYLYSRFVLLPRQFMSALRRAIARQVAAPNQLPLQLQRATHYSAFFNANQGVADCWAAARYISVGRDCPVQRLWIRACDDVVVSVEATGSKIGSGEIANAG
jgi:hypothetical protein